MFAFYLVWPYMGLGAALLLALLLTTDALRSDRTVSRWRDLVWLAWLGTLAYLVHQFEEHGVDALGATYAFRGEMCRNFGFPDVEACPIPFSFVTAVNISVVWVFGPAAALLGRRRPELALAFFAVPIINAIPHIVPAAAQGTYNAGLVTAIVIFVPLSLWVFHVALSRYRLGWRAVIATLVAGVVYHVIMIASAAVFVAGRLDVLVLDAIQVINPALILLIVGRLGRRRTAQSHSDNSGIKSQQQPTTSP
ncbi:MAG TPA: HXXEE domain-containing protein [Reyranella sp.]